MTNYYSMNGFPQDTQANFVNQQNYNSKKSNTISNTAVLTSGVTGMLGGGAIGYFKNRYPVKNGTVSDTFAKIAFNNYIDKGLSGDDKEFFKQLGNIKRKLDKIKTPEEFKKLLNDNRAVTDKIYNGVPLDTVCESVTSESISGKISALKTNLESAYNNNLQNMKDTVKMCWDTDKKKFVKPDTLTNNKIFEAIKSTKNSIQWKSALKYGGIGAGILGGLALAYKLLTNSSDNKPQEEFSINNP